MSDLPTRHSTVITKKGSCDNGCCCDKLKLSNFLRLQEDERKNIDVEIAIDRCQVILNEGPKKLNC